MSLNHVKRCSVAGGAATFAKRMHTVGSYGQPLEYILETTYVL